MVDGWLGSPEHRANIEAPEFRATGVGAAGAPAMYWAQTFGVVADADSVVTAPVAPATVPASPTRRGRSAPAVAQLGRGRRARVRVSCAQHGRGVACRVRGARGTTVRIALMRGGHTFARARTRAAPDPVRVRLHPMRRLRAGRYALVVRAGSATAPSGTRIMVCASRARGAGSLPGPCSRSRTTSRPIARRSSRSR